MTTKHGLDAGLRVAGLILVLSACATAPSGGDRDLADEVRHAASGQDGVIDVYPLADPSAEALIGQARELERANRAEEAAAYVRAALEISPNDPGYWQYLAELDLKQRRYREAVRNAGHSFHLGPQIGQLCYRNWLTLSHAFEGLGEGDQAAQARSRAESCTVKEQTTY